MLAGLLESQGNIAAADASRRSTASSLFQLTVPISPVSRTALACKLKMVATSASMPETETPFANTRLSWEDILVIVPYFLYVLIFGIWSSCRGHECGSVEAYFLAGRNMHGLLVGASLFASNIGSAHFIGLAGAGARSGIAAAGFELNAIFILVLLGWVFVPVYLASGVYTMPEYMMRRFNSPALRLYITILSMLLYIFTKLSVDLYAGAIFIKQTFNTNIYLALGGLILVSAIFTTAGGLTAVIWTDAIQVVIMLLGAAILMVTSIQAVGGQEQLFVKYLQAIPTNSSSIVAGTDCHIPPQDAWRLFRPHDQSVLPWTGMIFGSLILSVWYWCSDQVLVQRVLAATNYSNAKAGCLMAGWLKFLTMWLLVIPGMAARILYPNVIACTNPEYCSKACESPAGCSNMAYTQLVLNLLGPGLRGLIFACILSALISSLTSVFNSVATIVTLDVWKEIIRRERAGPMELLLVAKLCIIILVVISFLWIFIIQNWSSDLLFRYIQATSAYLAPPVSAIYLLAVFVPRVNRQGAVAGLSAGLAIGAARFIMSILYPHKMCGDVDHRSDLLKMHYMHFAILLFLITVAVAYSVSMVYPPQSSRDLIRLTYWTRKDNTTLPLASQPSRERRPLANGDIMILRTMCEMFFGNSVNVTGTIDVEMDFNSNPTWAEENNVTRKNLQILAVFTLSCNVFYYAYWA